MVGHFVVALKMRAIATRFCDALGKFAESLKARISPAYSARVLWKKEARNSKSKHFLSLCGGIFMLAQRLFSRGRSQETLEFRIIFVFRAGVSAAFFFGYATFICLRPATKFFVGHHFVVEIGVPFRGIGHFIKGSSPIPSCLFADSALSAFLRT